MGSVEYPAKAMRVLAAFSRHDAALDWARDWAISRWGPIALESPRFEFTETSYYESSMGAGLKKTFFGFVDLMGPTELVDDKLRTNEGEFEYAAQAQHDDERPLNLDPGYLTESKFLLATTKDHAHRIYLDRGIYAEITLRYFQKRWQPWDWTYPDYCREDFIDYFTQCRECYRRLRLEQSA